MTLSPYTYKHWIGPPRAEGVPYSVCWRKQAAAPALLTADLDVPFYARRCALHLISELISINVLPGMSVPDGPFGAVPDFKGTQETL